MKHQATPNNPIRRVMDAGLPGLEDDPYFEERVLQRIRAAEKKPTRAKRQPSRGLAVALALVLMTMTAVTVSLMDGAARDQSFAAASMPEGGFADAAKRASYHTCQWEPQDTHQTCYRYDSADQDVLCARQIYVCGICGKTNGFTYEPIPGEAPAPHDWVTRDTHLMGTTIHVFYQECVQCHAYWDRLELACSGDRDIHIDPRYYTQWRPE